MRAADVKNTGLISRNEIILSFVKSNMHQELTSQFIGEIINVYYPVKSEKIDYMKLISYFLKDLKVIIEVNKKINENKINPIINNSSENFNRPNTSGMQSLLAESNKNTLKNPNKTTTGFYNTNKNFSQIALNDNPIKEGNKKNFYLFFRK